MKRIKESILKPVFEGSPVHFAYIYSSMATGQAHPFSDLDIAIYVPSLSLRDKIDLEIPSSSSKFKPPDYP